MELIRNLLRRKLRTGLTVGGIAIGVLALTTMGALAEKTNLLLDGGVAYFAGHVAVTDQGGSSFAQGLVKLDLLPKINAVDGVAAAFPTIGVPASRDGGASFGPPAAIVAEAAGYERYETFKLRVQSGRQIAADDRGRVVLGTDLAKRLNAQVGSRVTLPIPPREQSPGYVPHQFEVVGLLDKTLTAPDNFAYVSLLDAQMLLGDRLPPAIRSSVDPAQLATGFDVYGTPGTNLDQLAHRISAQVPDVKALPPSELVHQFQSASVIFTAIITGSAILALVVGGLSVVNTMIMAVSERVREIGVRKAVGARTGHIMAEYLLEATTIGGLGGLIGVVVGWLVTVGVNAATAAQNLSLFLLTPRLAVFSMLFAIGLGAGAGLIPSLRAARLDPVTALRHQ